MINPRWMNISMIDPKHIRKRPQEYNQKKHHPEVKKSTQIYKDIPKIIICENS